MPVLTTFGGASLRSFGRGIEQVAAALPANTVLLYHVTDSTTQSATPDAAWSLTTYSDKYIVGAANQSEVGTTVNYASGTATLSGSTSTSGAHYGNQSFFSSPYYATNSIYSNYGASSGGHSHGFVGADLSNSLANTVAMSTITTTTSQSMLPAGTIVFRKVAPTSLNFTQYAPSGNGYIYSRSSHANTSFTDQTVFYSAAVTSLGAAGTHYHAASAAYMFWGAGYQSWVVVFAGDHNDHAFNFPCVIQLKSKNLNAWISTTPEPIEYGMIVMYDGLLSKLPAGWRVCDGTLGTPDMRGYALSLRSGLAHDATIHSTNGAALSSAFSGTTTTSQWAHDHQGSSSVNRGSAAHHAISTAPHSHSVSLSSITGTYTPPSVKLAFIQYKGI